MSHRVVKPEPSGFMAESRSSDAITTQGPEEERGRLGSDGASGVGAAETVGEVVFAGVVEPEGSAGRVAVEGWEDGGEGSAARQASSAPASVPTISISRNDVLCSKLDIAASRVNGLWRDSGQWVRARRGGCGKTDSEQGPSDSAEVVAWGKCTLSDPGQLVRHPRLRKRLPYADIMGTP